MDDVKELAVFGPEVQAITIPPPDLAPLRAMALQIDWPALTTPVTDDASAASAAEHLKCARAWHKLVTDTIKPAKQASDLAHANLCALEHELKRPGTEALEYNQRQLLDWDAEMKRRRAARERALQEEENARVAAANEAARVAALQEAMPWEEEEPAAAVPAPVIERPAQIFVPPVEVPGWTTQAKPGNYEVTDMVELLKSVAAQLDEHPEYAEAFELKRSWWRTKVRQMGSTIEKLFAGIRYVEERTGRSK